MSTIRLAFIGAAIGLLFGAAATFAHTQNYGPGDNYDGGHDGHADTLDGGGGDDRLEGQGHNDSLRGATDQDTILGDGSDDDVHGGDGRDAVFGGAGDDEVDGGPGADFRISGGTDPAPWFGKDKLFGDNANDLLTAQGDLGDSPDVVRGEDGFDTCYIDNGFEESVTSCEAQF